MKRTLSIMILLLGAIGVVMSQSPAHPWHAVNPGGGKASGGGLFLHSSVGQPVAQASASGGSLFEGGYIPGIRELGGTVSTLTFNAEYTWNMVSVPFIMSDFRKTSLYPTSNSPAFAYTVFYEQRDTLKNLVGYWLKFPAAQTIEFTGTAITADTVDVGISWNLIGTLSYPVLTSDIAQLGTTVVSSIFGYRPAIGYYTEDTLQPGHAYWVKVSADGQLAMRTGSAILAPSVSPTVAAKTSQQTQDQVNFSTLTIRDAAGRERTLSFTGALLNEDATKLELPPVPPSFDVRYSSNRMEEYAEAGKVKNLGVRVTSAEYPLTLTWKSRDAATLMVGQEATPLKGNGMLQIKEEDAVIKLQLTPSDGVALPKEFALFQNYPNPFNPITSIRYDLPTSVRVSLKIYNVLGQEVTTLVDEVQDAGYKRVKWDASAVASGLYYYRFVAGDFTDVRKMMVVK